MIIPLEEGLRLVGKEHAWELQKRRKKNGVLSWQSFKYYRRLSHALSEAGERRIRLMPGESLAEALAALDTVRRDLWKILDSAYERTVRSPRPNIHNQTVANSVESSDTGDSR